MTETCRFSAYAAHEGAHHRLATTADSFEAAALAFAEAWHPSVDGDDEVRIIVIDRESGCEQCFTLDVGTGQTAPC